MSDLAVLTPDAEALVSTRSVVAASYKQRYSRRAADLQRLPKNTSRKVVARSCGDWLALTLARLCVDPKGHLKLTEFESILSVNGVDHSKWNRTSKGWQGRLRMTGRLALQRVVAEADGELELADGTSLVAPKSWVAKFTH